MKKNIFCVALLLAMPIYTSVAFAQMESVVDKTVSSTRPEVLPPIRRIGIDTVETNVDEFRSFMRKQDRLLHGVPSLPYNEQDIKSMLAKDMEAQTKNTGRFWELSFSQFLEASPSLNKNATSQKPPVEKILKFKHSLEADYNLDGWIKPLVYFAPDQTLVRVTLKGINSARTLAREDILLDAQASEDKIVTAMGEALSRIVSTLGHDGRVTYTRDNLMALDFGSERGVQRGQKMIAGYVILSSFHPQTGEFLRGKRVPLYELKVLEAQKGSSLCQITALDRMKLEQVTKMTNNPAAVLLAWKPDAAPISEGWKEPYDPQTAPILGAAESGFGVPVEKQALPPLPSNMAEPSDTIARTQPMLKRPIVLAQKPMPAPEAVDTDIEPLQSHHYSNLNRPQWDSPGTWNFKTIQVGGGTVFGSFAEGQSSSFPVTLLNRFQSSAFVEADANYRLFLEPYAQFAFFNGSAVTGSSYFLGARVFNELWADKPSGQSIFFGGGPEYTGGSLTSSNTTTDLANLQLEPAIRWNSNFVGFGRYSLQGSFSLFDFVQAFPVWTIKAEIHPYELMTKQVSFDIGMKRYKKNWIEFSLGMNWDFMAGYLNTAK